MNDVVLLVSNVPFPLLEFDDVTTCLALRVLPVVTFLDVLFLLLIWD